MYTIFSPSVEDGQPDAGRDGRTRLARSNCKGANGDRETFIFPVELTRNRIGNLTRLIYTLLHVMTIDGLQRQGTRPEIKKY